MKKKRQDRNFYAHVNFIHVYKNINMSKKGTI